MNTFFCSMRKFVILFTNLQIFNLILFILVDAVMFFIFQYSDVNLYIIKLICAHKNTV